MEINVMAMLEMLLRISFPQDEVVLITFDWKSDGWNNCKLQDPWFSFWKAWTIKKSLTISFIIFLTNFSVNTILYTRAG